MTKKKIYRILLFSAIQVVLYIAIYEAGWFIGPYLKGAPKNDLFWGITAKYALITFVAISVIGTILSEILLYKIKNIYIIVFAISFIIFALLFIQNYSYTPFKTLLLLTSAFTALTVKCIISMRTKAD